MVKFPYNNSYQSSIQMAPFKAPYGQKCRSPMCWDDIGERKLLGLELITQTVDKVAQIKKNLQEHKTASETGRF